MAAPDIHVSEEKLSLEVEAGNSFSGEFHVYSTNGTPVRAKIFFFQQADAL